MVIRNRYIVLRNNYSSTLCQGQTPHPHPALTSLVAVGHFRSFRYTDRDPLSKPHISSYRWLGAHEVTVSRQPVPATVCACSSARTWQPQPPRVWSTLQVHIQSACGYIFWEEWSACQYAWGNLSGHAAAWSARLPTVLTWWAQAWHPT